LRGRDLTPRDLWVMSLRGRFAAHSFWFVLVP
jgi:hypothetical protein